MSRVSSLAFCWEFWISDYCKYVHWVKASYQHLPMCVPALTSLCSYFTHSELTVLTNNSGCITLRFLVFPYPLRYIHMCLNTHLLMHVCIKNRDWYWLQTSSMLVFGDSVSYLKWRVMFQLHWEARSCVYTDIHTLPSAWVTVVQIYICLSTRVLPLSAQVFMREWKGL